MRSNEKKVTVCIVHELQHMVDDARQLVLWAVEDRDQR